MTSVFLQNLVSCLLKTSPVIFPVKDHLVLFVSISSSLQRKSEERKRRERERKKGKGKKEREPKKGKSLLTPSGLPKGQHPDCPCMWCNWALRVPSEETNDRKREVECKSPKFKLSCHFWPYHPTKQLKEMLYVVPWPQKLTHMPLDDWKRAEWEEVQRETWHSKPFSVLSAATSNKSASPGQTQLNPGMKQSVSRRVGG